MLLELEHIEKRYATPDGKNSLIILKDISLKIADGESIAILGPSGSGKSTLLNIMGALDRPTAGKIRLAGQDLSKLTNQELAKVRNQQIGFIFQLHHLLPQCTALENVLIPTIPHEKYKNTPESTHRAKELLKRVGLTDRMDYRPGQLSGGECQRTAVVRALINKPKLILADEPTGSLDQLTALSLGKLLHELNQEQKVAIITVTHSTALANLMNRRFQLSNGILSELS
ncbi:ABC transporter ATP-binding protein [candidate division KSB1 bacterium]|nr:ABC transporter ATP-binding protein [candidate division KSB1 bacterium]